MHGIATDCHSSKTKNYMAVIKQSTGREVKALCIGSDPVTDLKASIIGDANAFVEDIALQFAADPLLADGFDIVAASQGGLLARAYVQRFNSPKVGKLITFGTPHYGIDGIPGCGENGGLHQLAEFALHGIKSIEDLILKLHEEKLAANIKVSILISLACALLNGATVFGLNKLAHIMPKYYYKVCMCYATQRQA